MSEIGLVLEGGGMRGVYTAGVLDCFYDYSLDFAHITGTSAGACNAVSYISKQRGRNFKIQSTYCTDKRYIDIFGLIKRGSIFGMDFLFDDIPNRLEPFDYDTFKNSETTMTCVTTDCTTGKAYYHDVADMKSSDSEYVKASSSIPLLSKIVEIDGLFLSDGGTADSIPIEYNLKRGIRKNIIVLTRENGYVKEPSKSYKAAKFLCRKYPKLAEAMKNRHIYYNKSVTLVNDLEKMGKAIVIAPKKSLDISRFEHSTENLKRIYDLGYNDAKERMAEILKFFND